MPISPYEYIYTLHEAHRLNVSALLGNKSYNGHRMASNNNWINRVLFKLNERFLDGSDFNDRRWIYDWDAKITLNKNLANVEREDMALQTLTNAKVIDSSSFPNKYREEQVDAFMLNPDDLIYVDWYDTDPPHREYSWIRTLNGFDYDRFMVFCELYSFNPTSAGTLAELEINSGSPCITIDGERYQFRPFKAGSIPQFVIEYVSNRLNEEVALAELITAEHSPKQFNDPEFNLNQAFKNNRFAKHELLGMFANITPKTILIKQRAFVTPLDKQKIQSESVN